MCSSSSSKFIMRGQCDVELILIWYGGLGPDPAPEKPALGVSGILSVTVVL